MDLKQLLPVIPWWVGMSGSLVEFLEINPSPVLQDNAAQFISDIILMFRSSEFLTFRHDG